MKKNAQKIVKKGQVTAAVILGLVLLVIVWLIMYLNPLSTEKNPEKKVVLAFQAEDVKEHIDGCVKEVSEDGLALMGGQGGRISPKNYLQTHYAKVGYAYYDGKKEFSDISVLEKELSAYVQENLRKECDLSVFEKNLEISEVNRVKAEASFKDNVIVDVTWSVTVIKDNTTFKFEKYGANIPVKMEKIYEIMNDIIKDYPEVDLTYMSGLENVTINSYPHEGLQSVYMIVDHKSKIKGKDYYIFAFATKP